jgi:hypothetical protein
MQRFANVTQEMILSGNVIRAKRCLQIAEELFDKGTTEIRNAITNVYLFSVSTGLEMQQYSIKKLLPEKLREEYCKQVNSSGL